MLPTGRLNIMPTISRILLLTRMFFNWLVLPVGRWWWPELSPPRRTQLNVLGMCPIPYSSRSRRIAPAVQRRERLRASMIVYAMMQLGPDEGWAVILKVSWNIFSVCLSLHCVKLCCLFWWEIRLISSTYPSDWCDGYLLWLLCGPVLSYICSGLLLESCGICRYVLSTDNW